VVKYLAHKLSDLTTFKHWIFKFDVAQFTCFCFYWLCHTQEITVKSRGMQPSSGLSTKGFKVAILYLEFRYFDLIFVYS
jgi:hypothetical protein